MRLAIFGATGPTGVQLVQEALERGYEVRALVRDVRKMEALVGARAGLEIRETPLHDVDALAAGLDACAAVLCALGARPSCSTITLMQEAVGNVVAAMRRLGIPRLIVCSSMCSRRSSAYPFLLEWVFKPLLIGRNLDDFCRMETFLASDCLDINFTVVKPPQLSSQPPAGRPLRAAEGDFLPDAVYRPVPRADLARFMLDCLKVPDWDRKLVSVGF